KRKIKHQHFANYSRDSQSLSESVINFPEEFGRTYPAFRPGSYAFPNDDMEIRRQELQYLTLNEVAQNRLHFAPWSTEQPPANVLDIATGTGSWAIDMADLYPEANVQGNDLSPIQPRQVPPLVHFFIEDAEDDWHYPQPFDYIHTRCCLGAFRDFNTNIVQQAYANLCSGGWFESQELESWAYCDDDSLSASAPLAEWSREMQEASEAFNRPLDVAKSLLAWYEAAGFVDVEEIVYKIPLGAWPRDPVYKAVGRKWQQVFLDGLSGFSLVLFNRHFGRTKEEIEATLVGVRRDVMDYRVHAYHKYHVVIGRKPFPGEVERREALKVDGLRGKDPTDGGKDSAHQEKEVAEDKDTDMETI
ncbi:hypothetical protein TD95_001304, partial [Thielaviopsis punctulata]